MDLCCVLMSLRFVISCDVDAGKVSIMNREMNCVWHKSLKHTIVQIKVCCCLSSRLRFQTFVRSHESTPIISVLVKPHLLFIISPPTVLRTSAQIDQLDFNAKYGLAVAHDWYGGENVMVGFASGYLAAISTGSSPNYCH